MPPKKAKSVDVELLAMSLAKKPFTYRTRAKTFPLKRVDNDDLKVTNFVMAKDRGRPWSAAVIQYIHGDVSNKETFYSIKFLDQYIFL